MGDNGGWQFNEFDESLFIIGCKLSELESLLFGYIVLDLYGKPLLLGISLLIEEDVLDWESEIVVLEDETLGILVCLGLLYSFESFSMVEVVSNVSGLLLEYSMEYTSEEAFESLSSLFGDL